MSLIAVPLLTCQLPKSKGTKTILGTCNIWLINHLSTPKGWKAELAWLADL